MSKQKGTTKIREPWFEDLLGKWADTVIKGWVTRMQALGMFDDPRSTGMLARSLQYTILWEARAADEVEYLHRIKFAFMYYGKMVDYGLGQGTDIKDRFEHGRNADDNLRKRKEWMYEPWKGSLPIINRLLRQQVGETITIMLKTGFEESGETFFVSRRR